MDLKVFSPGSQYRGGRCAARGGLARYNTNMVKKIVFVAWLLLVLSLLGLGGFYYLFLTEGSVTIHVDREPELRFRIRPNHRVHSLGSIGVYSEAQEERPLWLIHPSQAGNKSLNFAYGQTPPGWIQKLPPEPLAPGQDYRIHVSFGYDYWAAPSGGSNSQAFRIDK